jgi:hypothetical protein
MVELSDNNGVPLIKTAQTVTGSWADLGEKFSCGDIESLNLWVNLDVNDSLGVQFRALGYINSTDTNAFNLPITEATTSAVNITHQVFVLADSDQKVIIPLSVDDAVPYIKLQVKATTAGASAASIVSAHLTRKLIKGT